MALRIHVNVAARMDAHAPLAAADLAALLRRAARAALTAHGARDAELSITVVDDAAISELNRRYLGHEGPTDVISFELGEAGGPPVGDVYIGWDQALRQAASLGVPPREELARLAIHGTLHVLGYQHPEGAGRERSEMWQRQEAILEEVFRA